ncbi:hypothetical protein GY45DRAFT_1438715 [Cubamyces sp. BRFM 1775]|nr:hypothetical protein GY45DRAFT_1438715 [Cubamyces sp. BRFM 1775]
MRSPFYDGNNAPAVLPKRAHTRSAGIRSHTQRPLLAVPENEEANDRLRPPPPRLDEYAMEHEHHPHANGMDEVPVDNNLGVPAPPPLVGEDPILRDEASQEPHTVSRPAEMDDPPISVTLDDMKNTLEFIRLLQTATLEDSNLPQEVIDRIRNPPNEPLMIDDADLLLSIELYLAVSNASQETYNAVRDAIHRRVPDIRIATLYKVKKAVEEISGVVGQKNDMCPNSCLGYTGPYTDLEVCPKCTHAFA